jgi:uncharacterized protein with ParB-like and HNH nuclease domain
MVPETKTIDDLKDYSFFVPSYQRGYRWTKDEVNALLDDVSEFSTEGEKRYCIQPLIVKRLKDNLYEVVDGQQRLTTIYIFMKITEKKQNIIRLSLNMRHGKRAKLFCPGLPRKARLIMKT